MSTKKKIAYAAIIALIVLQFFRPKKNLSETVSVNHIHNLNTVPAEIESILKTSCYDCHSNNTYYPWYTNIQPVGLWMQSHVNDGKDELNFSEFASYSPKRKNHKYKEIIEMVEEDEMPIFSYTLIHGNAKLSKQQKDALLTWAAKQKTELNYKEEKK